MKREPTTCDARLWQNGRPGAFTLVEMLTVMAVISILAALAVPGLRGLNQTGVRRAAVSDVMNVLDRARVMAISDGRATYVVFACKTATTPLVNAALWGRAYAIYEDSDNINFQPVQRTPWLYLPTSAAFKVDDGIPSVTNRPLGSSDPAFPLNTVAGAGSAVLPYLKFDPTGMVDEQDAKYLRVLVFPGTVDANGNEVFTKGGTAGASSVVLLNEVDVNPATGRARYIDDPADNLVTPTPTPGP